MKYQDIDHHNGMIVIPALALTKDIPLQALGMYVLITAHEESISFNADRMDEIFSPLYENQGDWKVHFDMLVKAGLIQEPVELETEDEAAAAERSEKARVDWDLVDEQLEEQMLEEDFKA